MYIIFTQVLLSSFFFQLVNRANCDLFYHLTVNHLTYDARESEKLAESRSFISKLQIPRKVVVTVSKIKIN